MFAGWQASRGGRRSVAAVFARKRASICLGCSLPREGSRFANRITATVAI